MRKRKVASVNIDGREYVLDVRYGSNVPDEICIKWKSTLIFLTNERNPCMDVTKQSHIFPFFKEPK